MADELQLDDLLAFNRSHDSQNETAVNLKTKLSSIKTKHQESELEKTAVSAGLTYIDLTGFPISLDALALIPEQVAIENKIGCFFYNGEDIKIGITDHENKATRRLAKEIAEEKNCKLELFLISEKSFAIMLDLYSRVPKILATEGTIKISNEELKKYGHINSFEKIKSATTKANTSELIGMIVASAINTNSSDIHVEAEKDQVVIRFRIDGILYIVASVPHQRWPQIISRIKLLAGLKINIDNKPQDGRITINLDEQSSLEIRVSTIPTTYGESVVMRLLKPTSISLAFADLGLHGKAKEDLDKEVSKPNGMILTTGPTGSGKTTTLYSILNKLNNSETKIITLEDPVEYKLNGISQSQIDHSKHYSFADGLRSILRQDPDVIMVGEIRDLETADVAINSALTGHLVISTIHTNSAAGAIPRMLAMGVKPFLLAPALNAVIGQRLIRRLCENCKQEIEPETELKTKAIEALKSISSSAKEKLSDEQIANVKFYGPKGCDDCQNLGYKGRVGIYEIMNMTPELEKLILLGNVSGYDIEQSAIKNGMVTMLQDGVIKATNGLTSLKEVFDATK